MDTAHRHSHLRGGLPRAGERGLVPAYALAGVPGEGEGLLHATLAKAVLLPSATAPHAPRPAAASGKSERASELINHTLTIHNKIRVYSIEACVEYLI